jgi:hypothetical protein
MAFRFGVTSMVRTAGLETTSSSIPQASSRNILSALLSASPSASPSSTVQQPQHRQQKPQELSQILTENRQHRNPLSNSLTYSYLPPRNAFSFLPYTRQNQQKGYLSLRSSPVQRLQPQAPPASRCSYCLTGTSYSWTSDDDHKYDYEVVGRWEQDLGCT